MFLLTFYLLKILEEGRFKELKRLIEAQSEQIDLLKEEIDILKQG